MAGKPRLAMLKKKQRSWWQTGVCGGTGPLGLRAALYQRDAWCSWGRWHIPCAPNTVQASCSLPHYNLTRGPERKQSYHKVTEEETEAWRGEVPCPCESHCRVCMSPEGHVTTVCTSCPMNDVCLLFICYVVSVPENKFPVNIDVRTPGCLHGIVSMKPTRLKYVYSKKECRWTHSAFLG